MPPKYRATNRLHPPIPKVPAPSYPTDQDTVRQRTDYGGEADNAVSCCRTCCVMTPLATATVFSAFVMPASVPFRRVTRCSWLVRSRARCSSAS